MRLKSVEVEVQPGCGLWDCRKRAVLAAAEYECNAWFIHNDKRHTVKFTDLMNAVTEEAPHDRP